MYQGVRGVATGFIVAFDKHWNLAMKDVEEQFTRRRTSKVPRHVQYHDNKFKVPALGGRKQQTKDKDCEKREEKIGESVVRVVKVEDHTSESSLLELD